MSVFKTRLRVLAPRAGCLKGNIFLSARVRILAERLSQWGIEPATENSLLPIGSYRL